MIGSWLAYSAASDPNKLPYDFSFWRAMASVTGSAMSAWLTFRHSRAALPVAAATAVGTAVSGALNKRLRGRYATRTWPKKSWREAIFNRAMPLVQAAESAVLVGAAVKSTLKRQSKGLAPRTEPLLPKPWYPQARKLGLYFMTFSLLGHWGEMLFCMGIKHGIFKGGYDRENHMLWDQWLFPFPAEGTAAVLADLVLTPAKQQVEQAVNAKSTAGLLPQTLVAPFSLAASFLLNQVVCTAIDFATGMVANRHYELWDYRDMRFNFMGQICLQNSLFYSTVATLGVWCLLPALERVMSKASTTVLDGLLVGMGSAFAFLELLYHVTNQGDA